jgi:hypothetical protein
MERVVFYRERGALPYDPFAYGMAIALVEIPYLLIQVCCCACAAGAIALSAQRYQSVVLGAMLAASCVAVCAE